MRIVQMYKIHSLDVAQGIAKAPKFNSTFYETYDEALKQARDYATKGSVHAPMVIYKAHVLVRSNQPSIEVLTIERDGEVIPLR